jgi:uncharacterized protein
MRLDDQDGSSNYEVQSGYQGAGFGGGGGGGGGLGLIGMLFPFVFSRFGCTGVAVLGLLFLVFGGLGSVGSLLGGGGGGTVTPGSQAAWSQLNQLQRTSVNALVSNQQVWADIFAKSGQRYAPTTLSFYNRNGISGCGAAQSAMGPFYCPSDQKIYLDTDFFRDMETRMGVSGDFPVGYVIAHEMGHHIQNLLGLDDKVRAAQARASRAEGNAIQVAMELQADCYAGVWAARARTKDGGRVLEAGDIEEGMNAAQAIGDDTLQRAAGQRPVPESFTHGSSAQRMQWLQRGLQSGDPDQCNTFGGR